MQGHSSENFPKYPQVTFTSTISSQTMSQFHEGMKYYLPSATSRNPRKPRSTLKLIDKRTHEELHVGKCKTHGESNGLFIRFEDAQRRIFGSRLRHAKPDLGAETRAEVDTLRGDLEVGNEGSRLQGRQVLEVVRQGDGGLGVALGN